MKDLPNCEEMGCGRISAYFILTENKYVCSFHYTSNYKVYEAVQLISSRAMKNLIDCAKYCLEYFKEMPKRLYCGKHDERSNQLCEDMEAELEQITSEYIQAEDQDKFDKFISLKSRVESVQHSMDANHIFTKFARELMWEQIYNKIKTPEGGINLNPDLDLVYERLGEEEVESEGNEEIRMLREMIKKRDREIEVLEGRVRAQEETKEEF
ncbi:unnamed protein product [Moneuplotes crassus]|uniref:Uncharacterized protein n=1 Tax=Euplotes crassus TaxID=5936 RepID=A0AAD1XWA8_EUPCR|nr:unnamed protein product [Moneuplotes crassus]